MKKSIKKLAGLAMAFGIAGTALFAGGGNASAASGWQILGVDTIEPHSNSWVSAGTGNTHVAWDGGSVGFEIPKHTVKSYGGDTPKMLIQLYESDPGPGNDKPIGKYYYYPKKYSGAKTVTFNVEQYEDGWNGKAEVYAKYTTNYVSGQFTIEVKD